MEINEEELEVFLNYQKRWLLDDSKVKLGEKSRRIGLTWAEQFDAVMIAYPEKYEGGCDYLYISTRIDLAKEFIDGCNDWIQALLPWDIFPVNEILIADPKGDIKSFVIDFPSGNTIFALSSNPSNMRGMQGVVCIDEAAHQIKLPELLKAAFAMLMWGGKLRLISTHNGELSEFNQLIKSVRLGKSNFSLHTIDIEQALADGLFKRICLVMGSKWTQELENSWLEELISAYGDGVNEELYCLPSSDSRSYFSMTMLEAVTDESNQVLRLKCSKDFVEKDKTEQTRLIKEWLDSKVAPLIDNLLPLNYTSYAGLDFGRSHDLTVLSILIELIGGQTYFPFVLELRDCPFHAQAQICTFIFKKIKRFRKAAFDATGNGSFLAEEMTMTFGRRRIESVRFSEIEYLTRFPRYKSAIQNKSVFIPKDPDIIDDHLTVTILNGVPKVPTNETYRGTDNQPRHGDSAISLMLAYSVLPPRAYKVPSVLSQTLSIFKETSDDRDTSRLP
jgi:phage FluMu gp28-like protein